MLNTPVDWINFTASLLCISIAAYGLRKHISYWLSKIPGSQLVIFISAFLISIGVLPQFIIVTACYICDVNLPDSALVKVVLAVMELLSFAGIFIMGVACDRLSKEQEQARKTEMQEIEESIKNYTGNVATWPTSRKKSARY